MRMKPGLAKYYLLLILVTVIFGSTFVVSKLLLNSRVPLSTPNEN